MIILFGGSMLVIWPVLLPMNAVRQLGPAGGVTGMDIFSISNISPGSTKRYWAHVAMAIYFVSTFLLRKIALTLQVRLVICYFMSSKHLSGYVKII